MKTIKNNLLILALSHFSVMLAHAQNPLFKPLHIKSYEAIVLYASNEASASTEHCVHLNCDPTILRFIPIMPVLYEKYSSLENYDYICTPGRYKRFDPKYVITIPASDAVTLYERQMHYRSAEMVMQSWQNATGWQNTTITIKNTRL